ncbi:MAG: hypothetical protein Q9195_000883 [Heterodermia aff. obscurata]
MAVDRPPSISGMQHLSNLRKSSLTCPEETDNTYRMMVLRFEHGLTEEDVDQQFLQIALKLGINVPQEPKTTLDIVTSNVSALSLTSAPSEPPPPPSRNSHSTHPPSDSSSEQQRLTKTSSLETDSITSAASSLRSASSSKSSYLKIKRGLQRISALRRRKTIDSPIPALPFTVHAMQAIRPSTPIRPAAQHRPRTNDSVPVRHIPPKLPAPQASDVPPRIDPIAQPGPIARYHESLAARHRSMNNIQLRRLRASQLDEQTRFIRFEEDQYRLNTFKHSEAKRDLLTHYLAQERMLQDRHVEALVSLEHRHLSAEVDLNKALELERQGCDTRLKHMQAYCNPKSTIAGMPTRVVTRKDYHQLEQQYHIRNGMDNLHKSRINVLREKQGKQLERISAKQEAELEELSDGYRKQVAELESSYDAEKEELRSEFGARKKRLLKRWALAEAIERRKIENETAESYGPLPAIPWDERDGIPGLSDDDGFADDSGHSIT